jgi:hypothetical protein
MFRSLAIGLVLVAALLAMPQWDLHQQASAADALQGRGYWSDAPPPQWGRPHNPHRGACFYKDANYSNVYFCVAEGQRYSSLPPGFNDVISSIRLFGSSNVRIFNDTNFGGMSAVTRSSVSNLKNFPLAGYPGKHWNDRISSLAVFDSGHDEWNGRGGPSPRH